MPRLSLAFVGAFEARLDDRPITGFETVKVRALLAYLALEAGRPHRREAVASLLWPDAPGEAARTYLRQALANLREVLHDRIADPPFLLITRDTIQFNAGSDHGLDIATFSALLATSARHAHRQPAMCARCAQRLEEAATVYRGPLLDGFFLGDSMAFEEWITLKREGLHQQALGVLTRLAQYHERRGAYDDVRRVAWRQIELDPWREEAHQQLMRALWRSGERSAALAQYERCRETLRVELGVEPAAETEALCNDIRSAAFEPSAQAPGLWHTPPLPTTPFIGREAELATLGDLLAKPGCQLLTLVGPGGIGKTRVATQLAQEQAVAFAYGVAFVSLVSVQTAAHIVPAIARALQITLHHQADPLVQLAMYLCDKELLLILDNFEHLQAGVGVLSALIRDAPGVTLLITSRERLNLREEWAVQIEGLTYPVNDRDDTLEAYSAARLFLETARRVQGGHGLSPLERQSVPRICRLVHGMPLALELAAAWVRLLSCAEIAAEIERSLGFLTTPSNNGPERHRSMHVVFERSWQLLADDEQRVLRQLAVFRGGCDRTAGLDVVGATLPRLAALVDKSLVHRAANNRYALHELVRQYAEEKLVAAGEVEQTRDRHLTFYLQIAEDMEPKLVGPEQEVALGTLESDHDNLRAALQWALDGGKCEDAARLAGALARFWDMRGYFSEGRRWLEAALGGDSTGTTHAIHARVRAKALGGAGTLADQQSDIQRAQELHEESLRLYQELGDQEGVARALNGLGTTMESRLDPLRAQPLHEESLRLFRALGDKAGAAGTLTSLGHLARERGDYREAAGSFQEALALQRAMGDAWGAALTLSFIGWTAWEQGDHDRAPALLEESLAQLRAQGNMDALVWMPQYLADIACYQGNWRGAGALVEESLALARQLGLEDAQAWALHIHGRIAAGGGDDRRAAAHFGASLARFRDLGLPRGIAAALEGCSVLAASTGRGMDAARLFGAAEALRDTLPVVRPPHERGDYERAVARARAHQDEVGWAAAWAAGRSIPLPQTIDETVAIMDELASRARSARPIPWLPAPAAPAYPAGLTEREVAILRLVTHGLTYVQIAKELIISRHTVNAHLRTIYGKLGVTSRSAATRFAVEHQLS